MKAPFWKKLPLKYKVTDAPKAEEGISLTYMSNLDQYICFGGHRPYIKKAYNEEEVEEIQEKESIIPTYINKEISLQQVHIFDPLQLKWKTQKCGGKLPQKRIYHIAWYEEQRKKLIIYGGLSKKDKVLQDMYALDTKTWTWRRFFSLDWPPARIHAAFVRQGRKKFFIGGTSYPENLLFNDIWFCTFDNVLWKTDCLDLPGLSWTRLHLQPSSPQMPTLKCHCAVQFSRNLIFVFGGYIQDGECSDYGLIINTEEKRLKKYDTRGKKPCARAFHQMAGVKHNVICLFGGVASNELVLQLGETPKYLSDFYFLNVSKNEAYWSTPSSGGYAPTARCGFAMGTNLLEVGSQVIILGGKNVKQKIEQSMYILTESGVANNKDVWGVMDKKDIENQLAFEERVKRSMGPNAPISNYKYQQQFMEADEKINKNKAEIGSMEAKYKLVMHENQQKQNLKNKTKKEQEKLFEEIRTSKQSQGQILEDKKKRNKQNQLLVKNLQQLAMLENKRRKLLEVKNLALQNTFRKAENYIITLDSFFTKTVQENQVEGIITESLIEKISKLKGDHRTYLGNLRESYEELVIKESSLKQDLLATKKKLNECDINLDQLLRNNLSRAEDILFEHFRSDKPMTS